MADYVFFGHGGRGEGTSSGTYVVPPNCTVHFFEKDGQLLNMAGASVLLDWLLRNNPLLGPVNLEVAESFGEYKTIPDYKITGDANAAAACGVPATGVYRVGRPKTDGPILTLATGVQRLISSIVGSSKLAFGTNIYWMCCRDAPKNTNTTTGRITSSSVSTGQSKARDHVVSNVGLTPSQVVAKGGKWR